MKFDITTICRLLDLKPRRVQQLVLEGVLFRSERGGYDLVKSVRGYVAYLREREERASTRSDNPALSRIRAAAAASAEMDLAARREALLPLEEIRTMQNRIATAVRSSFEPVPRSVASKIKPDFGAAKVEAIIRSEIDAVLEALSA